MAEIHFLLADDNRRGANAPLFHIFVDWKERKYYNIFKRKGGEHMLREGWNVHNDIALSLEYTARSILNPGVPYGADNTIYSADSIESGSFAECVVCLLRRKYGYNCNDAIDGYITKLAPVFGKSLHSVDPELIQALLDEFDSLMK